MKLFFLVGEPSGDIHAANLINALNKERLHIQCKGWGGDKMQMAGCEITKHCRELSFMGFAEVIKNLPTIIKNFSICKAEILNYRPDAVILVDYPGFNLRMAKWCKTNGFKVIYYIAPQLWAWKESRIKIIKQFVDRLFVILPFEQPYFEERGVAAYYFGHPLWEELHAWRIKHKQEHIQLLSDETYIALLPGSRKQEIENMLPTMVLLAQQFSQYTFIVAGVSHVDFAVYAKHITGSNIKVVFDKAYEVIINARAAIVTSGTATLETALLGTPQVVAYKGAYFSYLMAKRMVKIKYISLVNLILDHPLIIELIQDHFNIERLSTELNRLLHDNTYRANIFDGYEKLGKAIGNTSVSSKIAKSILEYLVKK